MNTQVASDAPAPNIFTQAPANGNTAVNPAVKISHASASVALDRIPDELVAKLKVPLPSEAIKKHPTKQYLSTIKSIYINERLNEVFGVGRWIQTSEVVERAEKGMVVVKSVIRLLDYPWFHGESYGGNDNADLGDAYKGACTDALTKIAATTLYIAMDVYKGMGEATSKAYEDQQKATEKDKKAAAAAAKVTESQQLAANPPTCEGEACGQVIKSWTSPKNKVFDVGELVGNSQKKYKKNLCAACQQKLAENLANKSGVKERTQ